MARHKRVEVPPKHRREHPLTVFIQPVFIAVGADLFGCGLSRRHPLVLLPFPFSYLRM